MSAIYFAKVGDYVKIGFSSNPRQRIKSLFGGRLIVPDDMDQSLPVELVLVIPFCRVRDERNMQLLFSQHWAVGEWFRWTPEFEHQMRTMRFVTHATRLKHLTQVRRELGLAGTAHVRPEQWGLQTPELLAEIKAAS